MKTIWTIFLLYPISLFAQQNPVPDSVMHKLTGMLCNCMESSKIAEADIKKGKTIFNDCFYSVTSIYQYSEEATALEKKLNNKEDKSKLVEATLALLVDSCKDFQKFYTRVSKQPELPEPLAIVKEGYFLDKIKMTSRKMDWKKNDAFMRTYTAKDIAKSKIQIVYDIRYVFKTESEAQKYYAGKLEFLSEGSTEIPNSLKSLGVSESNVYGMDPKMEEAFGKSLDMQQVNYIFRIKNVVAKIFVSASKKATPAEMLVFAKEAIARIKATK